MQKINWDRFGIKNENKTDSFEKLCNHLFCRKHGIKEGIPQDFNEVGLETKPILIKGQYYGFQAKFFEKKINYEQIEKSVKNAIKSFGETLDVITIYLNSKSQPHTSVSGKRITKIAKEANVKIEYFTENQFDVVLSQPSHLDLRQIYFEDGDELGFVKNCLHDPEVLNFLKSDECLRLPERKNEDDLIKLIQSDTVNRHFLIAGSPGSGKSVLMLKLFEKFAGFDLVGDKKKSGDEKMLDYLVSQETIPMLVNLRNCAEDSLEHILRERQQDYKIRKSVGFIYLFDGLDELREDSCNNTLSYISDLNKDKNTKKIIISCRSGNFNKYKAKTYLRNLVEYQIADLSEKYIDQFFKAKNNSEKIKHLNRIKEINPTLIAEIKDILLINLFWEAIEELHEGSAIIDLFDSKVHLLLNDPKHSKNLESLNLLNPKRNQIIYLNQDISFKIQEKFSFSLPQSEIQQLILSRFPLADYQSVNEIFIYISSLFFEDHHSEISGEQLYNYRHRRYQEYFFAQNLKKRYENNPKILRELRLLSNSEFFEKLFLQYLKREYQKENNLASLVELGLINTYLDNNASIDRYYDNSRYFISALANQSEINFEKLISDENLEIVKKVDIDSQEVLKRFKDWKKNWRSEDFLRNIWESEMSSLIQKIALFLEFGKRDFAIKLKNKFDELKNIFEEKEFIKEIQKKYSNRGHDILDPISRNIKDWLYIRMNLGEESAKNFFAKIRKNYPRYSDKKDFRNNSEKETIVKHFFCAVLRNRKEDLFELIEEFDEYEFKIFLDILRSIEYLPIFAESKTIHEKIKHFVQQTFLNESDAFILFYKRFFNIALSSEELKIAEDIFIKLRDTRELDLHIGKKYPDLALYAYIADKFSFESFLGENLKGHFRYYSGIGIYSALFRDLIDLLKNEKTLQTIVGRYIQYNNFYTETHHAGRYFKSEISDLWAIMFSYSTAESEIKQNLRDVVFKDEEAIQIFYFYLRLYRLNYLLFTQLTNESNLIAFEQDLEKWNDDLPSKIDRYFQLASLFSEMNPSRSLEYISKGINNGILRHGWRKDGIISYDLVDALEILWRNNWGTKKDLTKYSEEVFDLVLRVTEMVDGKEIWRGPYRIISLISKYDINLADKFKKKLIEVKGYRNIGGQAITSVLLGKVRLGFLFEEVVKEIKEYSHTQEYNYEGKIAPGYYEEIFKVYLEIAKSDLYSFEEKQTAFDKAYNQIEQVIEQKAEYYLKDLSEEDKLCFQRLCADHKKEYKIPNADSSSYVPESRSKEELLSREKWFVDEVSKLKKTSKKKIKDLYKKIENYDEKIVLSQPHSWKILLEKTYEINQSLDLFIELLRNSYFPSSNYYTANSKYFHIGVAIAIKNPNTKQQVLKYISENAGHNGFSNILEAYEFNKDKETCLKLFERFLKISHLLVD